MVALTGRNEAYYTDYRGTPQELISARQVRLPVPGPALRLAEAAPRHARRSTCRRAAFVTLPPEPRPGRQLRRAASAATQLTQPGPLPGADRAAAARPGDADAVPGAGVRRLQRRSSTSPTTSRSWRELVRKGRARVPRRSSRSLRRCRRSQAQLADPARPGDVRALQARPRRARAARRGATRCTATCSRLRREDPAFRAQRRGAASTARCSAPRRSCCASSAPTAATTGCCSSTSAATCTSSPRPSRCSRRPPGMRWARALVERGPALRRHAARRRPRTRTAAGASPASRRCCSPPRPSDGERDSPLHGRVNQELPRRRTMIDIAEQDRCRRRRGRRGGAAPGRASGWSPTASAATPRAPSAGVATRRYHGLLVAALPAPLGRTMMLNHLCGALAPAGRRASSSSAATSGSAARRRSPAPATCVEFRLEAGLPVWRYEVAGRACSRSASSCRTCRTPSTSSTGCSTGDGAAAPGAAPVGPLPRRTTRRSATPLGGPTR